MYTPFEALLEILISFGRLGFFLFLVHTCFAIISGIVLKACFDEIKFKYFSRTITSSAFLCLLISYGSIFPFLIDSPSSIYIDIALWSICVIAVSFIMAYKLDD